MIHAFDEDWAGAVERAMESPEMDPIASFTAHVRAAVPDITIRDVIDASNADIGPTHPALVSRLRAVGVHEPTFDVNGPSALDALAPAHAHLVVRLLDALRQDTEIDAATETRNPPRLTPGTVVWAIVGAVFAAIFLYRFAIDGGPAGESLLIVLVITGLWLLYPLIYPWLQRELILDRTGVRIRSWWWRRLDPDARRLGWTQIPWTGSMSITIGFESIITFSNGARTTRWWGAIWPKRDLTQLVDDLRARGAVVRFTSDFGQQDHARHAVVWYVRDRFLVPEVRMTEEGDLLEVRPIKVVRPDPVPLMSALVDRLHDPVKPGGREDRRADTEYLASRVDLAAVAFTAEARRLFIDRDRDSWTIRLENESGIWVADRRMDEMDLAENIFGILGIEETV